MPNPNKSTQAEQNHYAMETVEGDTTLLDLPPEMVEIVMNHLPLRDILNFRGTCKRSSEYVQGYSYKMRNRFSNTQITLGFSNTDIKLESLNTAMCPYSRFKIQYDILPDKLCKLAQEYGQFIRHIYIPKLHTLMSREEFKCFEQLLSLQYLSVEKIYLMRDLYQFSGDSDMPEFKIPQSVFSNLRILKFKSAEDTFAVHFILQHCHNLEKLEHGSVDGPHKHSPIHSDNVKRDMEIMENINCFLKMRMQSKNMSLLELKLCVDIKPSHCYGNVEEFADNVGQMNIELKELSFEIVKDIHDYHPDGWDEFSLKVHSIRGICPQTSHLRLLFLEKLSVVVDDVTEINSDSENESIGSEDLDENFAEYIGEDDYIDEELDLLPEDVELRSNGGYARDYGTNWPSLKEIDIDVNVSGCQLRNVSAFDRKFGYALKYLLATRRYSITQLKLAMDVSPRYSFLLPRVLCTKFPNLIQMHLQLPFYTSSDIADLFRILGQETHIIELQLSVNFAANENIVIGSFREGTTFLQMSSLRHFNLSVNNSGNSATITKLIAENLEYGKSQTFFTDVLARSSLSCLYLQQCFPINISGINSLLNGNIANALRSFSLVELHKLTAENMKISFEASMACLRELTYRNACRPYVVDDLMQYKCKKCNAFR